MRYNKSSGGFTLIELLIVIAILGALAIGLLAALDPLEQLKKGADTATRNIALEFHNGIVRYYALKGYMPWCDPTNGCTDPAEGETLNGAGAQDAITAIVGIGELKQNFKDVHASELNKIYLYGVATPTGGASDTAVVCFQPRSKAVQLDANTIYSLNGQGPVQNCPAIGNAACYWCVQ